MGTEENSFALNFYKDKSMLSNVEPVLLCSFCVHFANQQAEKSRPKSPLKKLTGVKKRPVASNPSRNESNSSESGSSSSSSDSESSDSEDGACEYPGCKAVLRSPAALALHMKTKHPDFLKSKSVRKKYKSGVIKPVRVD